MVESNWTDGKWRKYREEFRRKIKHATGLSSQVCEATDETQ
jgi:hypothetical protein